MDNSVYITALVNKANSYVNQQPAPIVAFFGPTGSGKSTYINLLKEEYGQILAPVQIVTTRAPRQKESLDERNCVASDEFIRLMKQGKLTFVSYVYHNWHGARRSHLEESVSTKKVLIFDPNQFSRLDMIGRMFPCGKITTFYFLPKEPDYLMDLSPQEILDLFQARVEPSKRITMGQLEYQERMAEAVETTQEILRRLKSGQIRPDELVVNSYSVTPDQIYPLIQARIKQKFEL